MIIASAQTKPKRGNVIDNLIDHYRLIKMASDQGADLIAFPEMSITGYEREIASSLAFTQNDSRLDKLKQLSIDRKITIITGAPIKIKSDLFIGAFIMQPDSTVSIYTKQFLHTGEEEYFSSSFDYNPIIQLGNEKISLAICFDIEHPVHPEKACQYGCSLYIPSIFYSPQGISEAHDLLSRYAAKYSMNILLSNYCGETLNRPAGGGSAFWNKDGDLITSLGVSNSGLLIAERKNESWSGKIITD